MVKRVEVVEGGRSGEYLRGGGEQAYATNWETVSGEYR